MNVSVNLYYVMILGALRSVLSCPKMFEYCLLDRFKDYLVSADNQFGFKKVLGVGCSFAIRTVRNIVDSCVKPNAQLNSTELDLLKTATSLNPKPDGI